MLVWAATFFLVFASCKAWACIWFLLHGITPFVDYPSWKAPLLFGTDLLGAAIAGASVALLSWLRTRFPSLSRPLGALAAVLAGALLFIGAANVRVIQLYRSTLDRYLIDKLGDLTVMRDSIVANVDAPFLVILVAGGLVLSFVPRFAERRLHASLPSGWKCWALLTAITFVPAVGAYGNLRGHETLGLKHNPLLALMLPTPGVTRYEEPAQAYQRLSQRYPEGSDLQTAMQPVESVPAAAGHAQLGGAAQGYHVVMILLESVASEHLNPTDSPVLSELRARSLVFQRHYSTALNTYDAHYSIFRSMYVRGEALDGRKVHQGASRDPSIMEILGRAGYRVGMFHGSFLSFIDTKWVWEAPEVDHLVDAAAIVASTGVGWSWGADDDDLADAAADWMSEHLSTPTFLVFNPNATHHPYYSVPPYHVSGDSCSIRFRRALKTADASIGKFLGRLRQMGIADRTLLVVVSDHGETIEDATNVCGHGLAMNDSELRVPFFIHHPELTQSGAVETMPTNHVDVAPTVAGLVGAKVASGWLGRNLVAPTIEPRTLFVGLSHRRHVALITSSALADLDAVNGTTKWFSLDDTRRAAPSSFDRKLRQRYEGILRAFDDRVRLHHLELGLGRGGAH